MSKKKEKHPETIYVDCKATMTIELEGICPVPVEKIREAVREWGYEPLEFCSEYVRENMDGGCMNEDEKHIPDGRGWEWDREVTVTHPEEKSVLEKIKEEESGNG